jgi:hypothetical protein
MLAKIALAVVTFAVVFATLVLAAGSIPPQKQLQARNATERPLVERGQVIERVVESRRSTADRSNGAPSAP